MRSPCVMKNYPILLNMIILSAIAAAPLSKAERRPSNAGHKAVKPDTAIHQTTTPPAPPYDFTFFEETLWPQWVARFKSGTGVGEFSWLPSAARTKGEGTSIYGTTDLVYATFAVGQLGNLSQADRVAWADVINSFQNKSTGWFNPYPWEKQNQGNWPWHPTGAAMETLDLLNCSSCVPRYPMTANLAILAANESVWEAFMYKPVVILRSTFV